MTFVKFHKKYREAIVGKFGQDKVGLYWGNQNSRIVIIGQAWSRKGVSVQKPFSDKTGEKLRRWLGVTEEIFYDKDYFYLTALGLYFPGKDRNGGDAKPDVLFAKEWLTKELAYLNPKLIITIGKMAAEFVEMNYKVNVEIVSLPHPSPLNIKWFMDHPDFEKGIIPVVQKKVWKILNMSPAGG